MKKYFLLVVLLPLIVIGQKSKTTVKAKSPVAAKIAVNKEEAEVKAVKPENGFLINGEITGYPDGTPVTLHNGNNGAQELSAQIQKNKFTFTGSVPFPDFKVIVINGKQPYITLFLDNSLINIKGTADALDNTTITGSASNNEFAEMNNILKPYMSLFQDGSADTLSKNAAAKLILPFITKYPNSFVTPVAVYRYYMLTNDLEMMEQLFANLGETVKTSPIGNSIAQQIAIEKSSPRIGKPLPNFSQADSTGKMISLSSLRGKYVLVDFWASWCGPCRQENPNVVATYNKYKNKNYTVLGVSFDKTKAPWLDAIKMDGLNWTHVSDLQGWSNAVGQQFKITQIPQNMLIDPNGILIARNLRGPALESKLASLFGN